MARILVAEDEAAVRAFVVRALQHSGHEVREAADGAAALELLGAEAFDLLLTDIVMPVMDGIALALAASRDHPGLRILMMTGFAEEKRRAHNLNALIHDVISKPFSLDQLIATVDRALA
jgi:CheY-like chemotaxis protein